MDLLTEYFLRHALHVQGALEKYFLKYIFLHLKIMGIVAPHVEVVSHHLKNLQVKSKRS